jgi:hypothetical protein
MMMLRGHEVLPDGFSPKDQLRVMKFSRADAVDEHFQPDRWKLLNPLSIYSFCQTVRH